MIQKKVLAVSVMDSVNKEIPLSDQSDDVETAGSLIRDMKIEEAESSQQTSESEKSDEEDEEIKDLVRNYPLHCTALFF